MLQILDDYIVTVKLFGMADKHCMILSGMSVAVIYMAVLMSS